METIVAKFGGTSVGNGERIRKAAQAVVNEFMKGKKIAVVVSAINKTTDDLVAVAKESIGDEPTPKQMAEILAMGEMTSARVFSSVIESLGVKSEFIDPHHDYWPVLTDSNPLKAKINYSTSEEKAKCIKSLMDQGIIPVICGFLGKGPKGEITTLGRGGSDITAFFMGHALNASEVIIVTDVNGVMTTDPNKIEEAEKLEHISVEEMRDLATHGAQVLHPFALQYKDPSIKAKIISFQKGDLSDPGTAIVGPSKGSMLKTVTLYSEPISAISIVGESLLLKKGLFANLTNLLADNDINIFGLSAGENSISTFINKKDSDNAYHLLHSLVIESNRLSSLSIGKDIAMLTVVSPEFIETPGIISDITIPLRNENINIVEITSSQTAVVIFVEWHDGEKAFKLVKEVLE